MGVYGIAWVLPAIFLALMQAGAAQSVFLIDNLTNGHRSAAFISSTAISILGALLITAVSPVAAEFYRLPVLTEAFLAAAAFTLFMGLGVVDLAMTQRRLDFSTVALVQTTANLCSALLAIALGYLGYPLIGLLALQGAISPIQFLIFRIKRYPMQFCWPRLTELKEVWRHGIHLSSNTVTANILVNYSQLVLAASLPVHELGLFTLARRIVELINNQIGGIVGQVLFPSIAASRYALQEVAKTYLVVSRVTAMVMMAPLVIIVSAPAQFLDLFGGGQWTTGASVLVMLCLMQAGLAIGQNLFGVMQAVGQASTVWKWNIAFTVWQASLVIIFGRESATAAGAAMAASTLAMPLAAYILSRIVPFRMVDWARNYLGVFTAAALTVLLVPVLTDAVTPGVSGEMRLGINAATAATTYGMLVFILNFRFIFGLARGAGLKR